MKNSKPNGNPSNKLVSFDGKCIGRPVRPQKQAYLINGNADGYRRRNANDLPFQQNSKYL